MTAPRTAVPTTARTARRIAQAAPRRSEREFPARPYLRVVPDPVSARDRRLTLVVTTLLGMATCACLFATVALNVLLAQGQVHVDRLDGRAAVERVRQETLRRQVAELEAPRRVVSVATKHLGMVPVDNVRYLRPPAVAFSVRAGSGVGTEQPRE